MTTLYLRVYFKELSISALLCKQICDIYWANWHFWSGEEEHRVVYLFYCLFNGKNMHVTHVQ